ncbi:hypothetical protein HYDPIDRAFT_170199 [Hydnomerulius pinastri MD-312]|uniref:Uncharacterized protein n=1 Tax=Hydnomerulius pinastri MD-312 TaxID=994086 RepID=A0A0C9WAW2_9AGAM|nr:hypothetical protein HYDPIDRAFT_170199 [Hydnomerulius pinastri MD-312]
MWNVLSGISQLHVGYTKSTSTHAWDVPSASIPTWDIPVCLHPHMGYPILHPYMGHPSVTIHMWDIPSPTHAWDVPIHLGYPKSASIPTCDILECLHPHMGYLMIAIKTIWDLVRIAVKTIWGLVKGDMHE